MADLTYTEKRNLERFHEMGSGYVLDFSNRTFDEFVFYSTGKNIYDSKYDYASGSKANRLRGFWSQKANWVVGKLIRDLFDYAATMQLTPEQNQLLESCRQISRRLSAAAAVADMDAIVPGI